MMEIYRSDYQEVTCDWDHKVLKHIYFLQSWKFTEETFKADHLALCDASEEKLKGESNFGLLVDMRNLNFFISPELQSWHNNNVFPVLERLGVKKMAIIVSPNMFTEASVKHTVEESKNATFQYKYFKSSDEAFDWLIS